MAVDVFSVPVFLVVFRESLETVIIVSVLLAFLKQTLGRPDTELQELSTQEQQTQHRENAATSTPAAADSTTATTTPLPDPRLSPYRRLVRQVWAGTLAGLLLCCVVAAALIAVFYTLGADRWGASEETYEGAFALVASLIISLVGAALLRIGRLQAKWRVKMVAALEGDSRTMSSPRPTGAGRVMHRVKRFAERHALFVLPFITVLREGIEAIVFVAGVSFSAPARSVPLPAVVGLLAGISVGYLLYKCVEAT